ncbi:hypothetical protein [Acetobacter fabarum]|nr:hypothetical protein [Acetobacter fabarum]
MRPFECGTLARNGSALIHSTLAGAGMRWIRADCLLRACVL